jgi:hypothetical protein
MTRCRFARLLRKWNTLSCWRNTKRGYGLGSYSFFDQGVNIYAANAFEVPTTLVPSSMTDLLTVFFSTAGFGGILNVIDNTGGSSTIANATAAAIRRLN